MSASRFRFTRTAGMETTGRSARPAAHGAERLRRNAIGARGAAVVAMAFMAPAASVYFNTSLAAAGAGYALPLAVPLALAACSLVASAVAEPARKLPSAGLAYTFATQGFGRGGGFLRPGSARPLPEARPAKTNERAPAVPGCNDRLELHCALAASQRERLARWVRRRRAVAARCDRAFAALPGLEPLAQRAGVAHARHLYIVRPRPERLRVDRGAVVRALRAEGIGVNVHCLPVHLHPFYGERLGTREGQCPVAGEAYASILSLPLFPRTTAGGVDPVVAAVHPVVGAYRR